VTTDPLAQVNTRITPQSESARSDQVPNSAGGYVFAVTPLTRLRRFLTLGTAGGTYYVGERELTKDNAQVVFDMARTDGVTLVNEIVSISRAGRAPKQNPAIFALAVATTSESVDARRAAYAALSQVCRTGTHLFMFLKYVKQLRGWSRGLRDAVGLWYFEPDVDALAYQLVKYREREGYTHRDALRLAHPKFSSGIRQDLIKWVTSRGTGELPDIPIVRDFVDAQTSTNVADWVRLISAGNGLSWEMLPDAAMNERAVWEALVDRGLPQTALMRQLPRLTRLGLFDPGSLYTGKVAEQLTSLQRLVKARVHPVNVLIAHRTYMQGHGERGRTSWSPNTKIGDALDAAFYAAFGSVPVTGKRFLLALDVSGSMGAGISGLPITCREASAAIALVTLSVEANTTVVGFTGGDGRWSGYTFPGRRTSDPLTQLTLSARQRLDDATAYVSRLPFGGTDCALPAKWATDRGHDFDAITIFTDSETWAGGVHPFQALQKYRGKVGHRVAQVVVGMTATDFTIADPKDPDSLDVAGFDSAVPNLIADFAAGGL
jgi:60 kDa SS-A/Ro ribonucleoprotein